MACWVGGGGMGERIAPSGFVTACGLGNGHSLGKRTLKTCSSGRKKSRLNTGRPISRNGFLFCQHEDPKKFAISKLVGSVSAAMFCSWTA